MQDILGSRFILMQTQDEIQKAWAKIKICRLLTISLDKVYSRFIQLRKNIKMALNDDLGIN